MKSITSLVQSLENVLTFISTFNGIGAFTNALKQMGIKLDPKFICEIDKHANKTYYKNNPFNIKNHIDDIRDLLKEVKRGLKVDILIQTPPCQSFSMAGLRKGLNSSNGNLFLTAIQLQKKVNASIVVYENVRGLLSHDKKVSEHESLINKNHKKTIGHTLHTIEKLLLEDDRYNYYWEVLNANEQGMPQNRERIFIVGIKKELDKTDSFNFPSKIDIKFTVEDKLEEEVDEKYFYKNKANHKLNPTNQKRRDNKIHTIFKYDETMSYESTRRVYFPYVIPCITTGNNSKFLINGRIRVLTPTENKRIHMFSEDFEFVGTQTNINRQLGNTVSPGVYIRLFEEIFGSISHSMTIDKSIKKSNRGRKPKKIVIIDNHINLVKNVCNFPDLNYVNAKKEIGEEYIQHLQNSGTITLTVNKYKNVEEKKNKKLEKKVLIQIKGLEMKGDRTNTQKRFKIRGTKVITEQNTLPSNDNYILHNNDCNNTMDEMIKNNVKVDLIITDPPYDIKNTKTGGKSNLNKSFQKSQDELTQFNLTKGFDYETVLNKMVKLQDNINMYIWCNKSQIPFYLNYFVTERECSFDILKWVKTNPLPTYNNKYMSDTEYCIYVRKGGFCNPNSYQDGSTLFQLPINTKDKKLYKHPTIKPEKIIDRLVRNSSKENDTIFDPFMGSGTTGVSSLNHNRKFIGVELLKEFYQISKNRITDNKSIQNINYQPNIKSVA